MDGCQHSLNQHVISFYVHHDEASYHWRVVVIVALLVSGNGGDGVGVVMLVVTSETHEQIL